MMLLERPTAAVIDLATPRQAPPDQQLIALWLHGRPPHAQRAYRSDADRLITFVGKPLASVTLGDEEAAATSRQGPGRASAGVAGLTAAATEEPEEQQGQDRSTTGPTGCTHLD